MGKVNIYEGRPVFEEPTCSYCGTDMKIQVVRTRKHRRLAYWIFLFIFAFIGWLRDKKETQTLTYVCPECGNIISADELTKMRKDIEKQQKAWERAMKRHELTDKAKAKLTEKEGKDGEKED